MNFGALGTNAGHIVSTDTGSYVVITSNYTISGSAAWHLYSLNCAEIINSTSLTVTLTGTPNFSQYFAVATTCSSLNINSGVSFVFSGLATGTRYIAQQNGSISVAGAGVNYFPGNSAGSTTTGGQYN